MLAMKHRKAIIVEAAKKYIKAKKKEKTKILDEIVNITGYNRKYSARALTLCPGKVVGYSTVGGKKIKYVIGAKKTKRKREFCFSIDFFLSFSFVFFFLIINCL